MPAGDQVIRLRVERALAGDPSLAGIRVRSVNLGVVLLGGEAASDEAQLRAMTVARNADGVRQVESEVAGPDPFAGRRS